MLAVASPSPMKQGENITITRPSRSATSYMPGESAFVSSTLLARMKDDLFEHVQLTLSKLPGSKKTIEVFCGQAVVDSLMALGYAENREEGFAVASRMYADGFFRALQPGGFTDSVKAVYRFHGEALRMASPVQAQQAANAVPSPKTPAAQQHDRLFSIADILKTNDWINQSFVGSPNQNDADTTETDDNSTL